MTRLPPSVRWSQRVYGWLIQAYPHDHRRDFGQCMAQVFRDMASDAHGRYGLWGIAQVWLRVFVDFVWSVVSEHFRTRNRSFQMKTAFYVAASIALAMVVQMFVMAAIGIAALTVHLLSSGTMAGEPTHCLVELPMFFLPPLLAAMILVHTKPFYRPSLTAPLGAMAFFAFAFIADTGAPWWVAVPVIAFGGVLSLIGCYLGRRIPPRRRREIGNMAGAAP